RSIGGSVERAAAQSGAADRQARARPGRGRARRRRRRAAADRAGRPRGHAAAKRAAGAGLMNPRDRIASHLRRILVAAGMAIPQPGHADTSTPKPPGKPHDGKNKKEGNNQKKDPEHLGYE